ncbi:1,3-beta-glucanosyltransferase gel1 [Cytospora mali]|uniref:1,3-beta-glucanosyltransferase n=1 Tax=Cytospora mali TaxID=578113 RepID=A0A194VJM2_CYTMA|nr:1,3-beta-glucanosyltransferase gel1 [Valsa mali]
MQCIEDVLCGLCQGQEWFKRGRIPLEKGKCCIGLQCHAASTLLFFRTLCVLVYSFRLTMGSITETSGPHAVSPIHTNGRYFWTGSQRFIIRGVVYRLHGCEPSDPLVDERLDDLQRDITLFKELGLNTLFIYHIDSSRNHNSAMKLLAEAGIYVLISLPTSSCRSDDAGRTTTFRPYNSQLLQDCFATIDCMSQYPNTLGLIVANGAISTIYSTAIAPMISTVIRDIKRYMATAGEVAGQRQLPIGYSASRSRLILKTTFDYFTAGRPDETIDFFCYANFNWCGQSTMHISGYKEELKTFANAHIPIFFSQYGCNLGTLGQRIFQETSAIYSPAMTRVFSGGIAYEFYDPPDITSGHWGYGLVKEEAAVVGRGLTRLPDFHSLEERLRNCNKVDLQEVMEGETRPDKTNKDIPPLSSHWKAGHAMPYSMADWNEVKRRLEEKVWMDVGELPATDLQLGQHQPNSIRV